MSSGLLDNAKASFAEDTDAFVARLEQSWLSTHQALLSQKTGAHWTGELSTSALSTATAVSALVQVRKYGSGGNRQEEVDAGIANGCHWLAAHQNDDGGFGDTDRSHSNVATTLLVLAAWELAGFSKNLAADPEEAEVAIRFAWDYVDGLGRWDALRERYGKDKTFVVPILSNCALAGFVPWRHVNPLPFEAAWLPQRWYRLAKMPVVSYAIPALVAIGQARFHFAPPRNPAIRALRRRAIKPTLKVLRRMQPESGGYLEAVPLTSFVLMSLAAIGHADLPVAQECVKFILDSRLQDGSWPIDTNLAGWVTSLSVNAMARHDERPLTVQQVPVAGTDGAGAKECAIEAATVRWLLRCQHKRRHPFTGAEPGGWGWTDLSGAVPDADDTPAALLALAALDLDPPELARLRVEATLAAAQGIRWLLGLQNRDGGWPTFCRGWGKLPFDRSGSDLTAHAIRALAAWEPKIEELAEIGPARLSRAAVVRAMSRGFGFLKRNQNADGSWLPLWFGNQDREEEDNPVYGTGKVLLTYHATDRMGDMEAKKGVEYLRNSQNSDGGWGGGSSTPYRAQAATLAENQTGLYLDDAQFGGNNGFSTIEETAVALEALLLCAGKSPQDPIIMRGLMWLMEAIAGGNLERSAPIGFYFAKLWYYEKLYPTVFSLAALGAALRCWAEPNQADRVRKLRDYAQ